ncbi:IucA/IucC family protein [Agarivorans sp. QJM3NY_25]|uniref:IucA/IucC family protein n=1 Tax=Agarivorans sp. QJM3NY_25 TaxID=3421430 RepID=UPI003D7DAACD
MTQHRAWQLASQQLVAKILSELHFEERLAFEPRSPAVCEGHAVASKLTNWRLVTASRHWDFQASQSIWGMFIITPDSIQCSDGLAPSASQLLIDIQSQIQINDINLAGLLEEIQQTLYSDMLRITQLRNLTSDALVTMDETSRQRYLDAHPKAIANKGRLGWGAAELALYSPESGRAFQLHYLALNKQHCEVGFAEGLSPQRLLEEVLGSEAYLALINKLPAKNRDQFLIMAVHPWQMSRFLVGQFAEWFANGDAIDLGPVTGDWLAQQSIRTLSAVDPRVRYDVKTALTILNTSCYRGIPGKFIVQGPKLSAWLAQLTIQDPLFAQLGLRVQQEVAGVFCPQPYQQQVAGGSYRYQEMLGCIWRERAESVLSEQQRPMSMATLMQTDSQGKAAIVTLIELSGLSAEAWLRKLFKHVVVPLYHLMCRYGVALVAHGQNITLALQGHQPVGCLIKDFHGDLRLIDQDFPELNRLPQAIRQNLTRLPAHYLIHDLLTGHFVTVLRFVSPKLISLGIDETQFYRYLADEIRSYQAAHPQLQERFEMFDLLKPEIEKLCVNRVRFKIGYGDSEQRPLPEIGQPITNPLCV